MSGLPDASHLPVGMVLLPDGERLPVDTFFRLHGSALAAYPDAQIAVRVPAFHLSEHGQEAIKGLVDAATAALVAVIIKAPIPATVTSTVGAAYWSSDIAKWIAKVAASNERVKILTVREITGRGL